MQASGSRLALAVLCLIALHFGELAPAKAATCDRPAGKARSTASGDRPEGISETGWSRITDQLAASVYDARPQGTGASAEAWRFVNAGVGLEARFDQGGMRIRPRRGAAESAWDWGLQLRSFGPAGQAAPLAEPDIVALGNRIEYRRPDLTEWYINDRRGVEQGFTIESAPAGRPDRLEFVLALAGTLDVVPGGDGDSLSLRDAAGNTVLRYDGLHAFDAKGRSLPARLELVAGLDRPADLRIEVDVTGASYPVVVDPLITTQVAKLTAADAAGLDRLGESVSISGDTVVVGAYFDDDGGASSGSAYVFERNTGGADAWDQVAKLTAADAAAFDQFGISVSISGDLVVVGANLADDGGSATGSAYVFARNAGGADSWGQVAKLTASDAAAGDQFGISVSISGDTVVVGAYLGDDGGAAAGSAYVFERNAGGADSWGQVAKLTASDAAAGDQLGFSVSISGDTVVVGAYLDDDGGSAAGSAYVFERNEGGADAWGEVAKLTASDAVADDRFGFSVSISGDTVLVGAYLDDDGGTDSGSAYVFERNEGGADAWGQVAKLIAADAGASDFFGYSVAISGDGISIGARGDDDAGLSSGSAYVFERNAGGADAWGQVAKLTAADAAAADEFGWSVSLSGDTVVAGAVNDDDAGTNSGSAYIFTITGCEWIEVAKPVASDPAAFDFFGYSVSISGDTAVVGAWLDDHAGSDAGSVYLFERNAGGADAWGQVAKLTAADAAGGDNFGQSAVISGDTVVVGALGDDDDGSASGSAYVFERNAGGADMWGQVAKLTAADAAAGDNFGWSASISGDAIVVGARFDDDAGSGSGSAYVFERNEGGADAWGEVAKLTAADAAAGDQFGNAVSISGDAVVVGARFDDHAGAASGSAYVFERNAGGANAWGQVAKLTAADAAAGDDFAWSLAMSGDTVVVGAYADDDVASSAGSAYIFERNEGGADAWGQVEKLTATGAASGDFFGYSVAISGDTVVVGALFDDGTGSDSGSAFVFERNTGGADAWGQVLQLTASDAAAGDQFGSSVAVSGDTVVVGAAADDDGGSGAGSSYVFSLAGCAGCGDGVVDAGEDCDDGAGNSDVNPDACRTDCTLPACGDGVTDTGEACDDGNLDDGDGCESDCTVTPEICDGLDNDGDTSIDEGFDVGAPCGLGECSGGLEECTDDGSDTECPTAPGGSGDLSSPEVDCNGIDEDCDGLSFCACINGCDPLSPLAVIDEPGEDICTASYPDNFVPFAALFQGSGGGCGGSASAATLATFATFKTPTINVDPGDPIVVEFTGWASGSTGVIPVQVRLSADNTNWVVCGVTAGRNYLGNNTLDTVACASPLGAADLYVRLETTLPPAATVFLRDFSLTITGVCFPESSTDTDGDGTCDDLDPCGDGSVEAGEECDDGNFDDFDTCGNDCLTNFCGDAQVNNGEQCDDGGVAAGDGCSETCMLEVCGNGILDPGETCDDGNVDDTDACLSNCSAASCGDGFVWAGFEACDTAGESVVCNADCTFAACGDGELNVTAGEQCDDGGGVPGDGCSATCQIEICGNGVVDPGEGCDDGNGDNTDACLNDCTNASCGDGFTWVGMEDCDDSGESVTCDADCTFPICGDNTLNTLAGEGCDDGNLLAGDGCSPACQTEVCGNSTVDAGEGCDDGNLDNADACLNDCTNANCGDGFTWVGMEDCDDSGQSATCDADCTFPACGDNTLNTLAGEGCDDGNLLAGDGCSPACQTEVCGNSTVDAGEACDDGNLDNADACLNDCTNASCGDGFTWVGTEDCDDSGESATCDADCTFPACGDNTLNPSAGEGCDDGNLAGGDGCSATCQTEVCGNGVLDPGEQCDDGNVAAGDGCNASCVLECQDADGDGFGLPGDPSCGGGPAPDCDDGNAAINPNELENCDNLIDDDCDNLIDDADIADCEPLVARLTEFGATVKPDGSVVLKWQTAFEIDTVGFRILRGTRERDGANLMLVTPRLIGAQGNELQGASYEVIDRPPTGGIWVYYLESIDDDGTVERFGPVSATVPALRRGAGGRQAVATDLEGR